MLSSRALFSRLKLVKRVYFSSNSTISDGDGLSSFMNIVKSTKEELNEEIQSKEIEDSQSKTTSPVKFSTLLRNSDLVKLGYIKNGFVAKGTVKNVVNETVFIDYGGKFQLITQRPEKNREFYVRGAEVLLKIFDWELTARFIGSTTDSTLCESEGKIIKLLHSPYLTSQPLDDSKKNESDPLDEDMTEIDNYLQSIETNEEEIYNK